MIPIRGVTASCEMETTVEELLQAWGIEFPDPVDVFEDELAARLGLVRHPSCSLEDWRTQRVRLIDAAEDASLLPRHD